MSLFAFPQVKKYREPLISSTLYARRACACRGKLPVLQHIVMYCGWCSSLRKWFKLIDHLMNVKNYLFCGYWLTIISLSFPCGCIVINLDGWTLAKNRPLLWSFHLLCRKTRLGSSPYRYTIISKYPPFILNIFFPLLVVTITCKLLLMFLLLLFFFFLAFLLYYLYFLCLSKLFLSKLSSLRRRLFRSVSLQLYDYIGDCILHEMRAN